MATNSRRRSNGSSQSSGPSRSRRGFAAMDPEERREMARRGGEASHRGTGRSSTRSRDDDDRDYRSSSRGGERHATGRRGFAGMDPDEQREIARMGGEASHEYGHAHEWDAREARRWGAEGGRAAHERGHAHEWDSEEAREAGRRGGLARWGEDDDDYGRSRSYRPRSEARGRYEDDDRRPMSREEAGRRGAEARWGRSYGEGRYEQDDDSGTRERSGGYRSSRYEEDDGRGTRERSGGYRSSRYEQDDDRGTRERSGGYRSSRYEQDDEDREYRSSGRGSRSGSEDDDRPMSREEAGRRGAEARWGRSYSGSRHEEDDRGARGYRGHSGEYRSSRFEDDDRSFSREDYGHRGAEPRRSRRYEEDED